MSVENEKTVAKTDEDINADLEVAADDIFGTDVEIAAQAAEEAGKQTSEESAEQIKADEESRAEEALAKENEGKSPEEIEKAASEKKAAEDEAVAKKATDDLAKENEGKTAEEIAKAASEKKAAEEKEEPYKVPDDLKGRTRDRFEKLTGDLKTAHETTEKQEGVIKGFREVLERTGMNVTEVQNTLALGGLIKSDPARALVSLKGIVADLSERLGEVVPGSNPLEKFDDLKQQVADRELSIENARAIAESRIRQDAQVKAAAVKTKQQAEARRGVQLEEQSAEQFGNRVATAQATVGDFLVTIQNDPDAEKMAPHLIGAAKFAAENLAPEKWMEYIKGEHTKIKEIASAMASPAAGPTPIMDGNAPPGGQKEAQNLEQLADQML